VGPQNWTLNKKDKLKYLSDLGWWYVKDTCMADELPEGVTAFEQCCGAGGGGAEQEDQAQAVQRGGMGRQAAVE
jgi:hypothetical protein